MRMNLDGTENEVYSDVYGTYLNIAGGKLFCVRYVGDKKELSFNIENLRENTQTKEEK